MVSLDCPSVSALVYFLYVLHVEVHVGVCGGSAWHCHACLGVADGRVFFNSGLRLLASTYRGLFAIWQR